MKKLALIVLVGLLAQSLSAREWHVSIKGSDRNDGSATKPFRTISAAARAAEPGDAITVHEGTYRERVTPPRGGESDSKRIVYQTAKGEKAVIKGSEVVTGWEHVRDGVCGGERGRGQHATTASHADTDTNTQQNTAKTEKQQTKQ